MTTALDQFAFNVAVARLYELLNALADGRVAPRRLGVVRQALDIFTRLVAPMMPHLAAEIMARLHPSGDVLPDLSWPQADAALLVETMATIAVQSRRQAARNDTGRHGRERQTGDRGGSERRRTWRGRWPGGTSPSAFMCRAES